MHRHITTSRRLKVSIFACALLAFGLLLWARFLLVTGHPRTAIADPAQQRQVAAPSHSDDQ
jgi:hypothetical protein